MAEAAPLDVIALRLVRVSQLFNVLDPAPFHEKDLDPEADRFIFEWAQDIADRPFRLQIELPQAELEQPLSGSIEDAVHHHFAERYRSERRKLRHEFWRGRISLLIGLSFLAGCLLLRQLVISLGHGPVYEILSEGLLIIGWVAMWGPVEIFLYGWWPIAGNCRLLSRLAVVPISLKISGTTRPANP
ncbi:MAG: hypothetical protein HXY22_08115 [Alphaproteobacteria bacterium]|nr:hypothetical protein [Alphaproteobacteria bacterium]